MSSGVEGRPCGACRFLRRKCVRSCVFAPYFEGDQDGAAHFAAVHKVFGASNSSKLLLRLPPHKRLDAVISLCYEALARLRDPVYGCVAHIFSLQQQVLNLQAELAYIQAQLSTLQRIPLQLPPPPQLDASLDSASSSMEMSTHFDPRPTSNVHDSTLPDDFDDCELQALAHELISRYLSGARLRSPSSH